MACGIALERAGPEGKPQRISATTQRALLGAMGIAVEGPANIRRSLAAVEQRPWRRLLPPVLVWRAPQPLEIAVTLDARWQSECAWTLTLENGERHAGRFLPAALQVAGRRQFGQRCYVRYRLPLPFAPGLGYHQLDLHTGDARQRATMRLIAAPTASYWPEAIQCEGRVWGAAVQLYSLRSQRNWGIGDFGDLKMLVEFCAEQGAGIVGVSPLHALFPGTPQFADAYAPSSRMFLNVLHLDVEAIADFAECESAAGMVRSPDFQAQLRTLRAEELVPYEAVAAAKWPVLERLYLHFRQHHLQHDSLRGRAFRAFQKERGLPLQRHALFEALQAHFRQQDAAVRGWPDWPQHYRDPASPEVAAFLEDNRERVEFYAYLQWQADLQLSAIGRRSWELGLGVGLQLDLAAGVCQDGADAWTSQPLYARHVRTGVLPNDCSRHESVRDWVPPLPQRLEDAAYAPWIATLRAGMRHAGALRIGQVAALQRQFWIPAGGSPDDGAWVSYPFTDLLGILALESWRNQCMIVADLAGAIPEEVGDALLSLGMLPARLLLDEKESDGSFKLPAEYSEQMLVTATACDQATLAGFWQGRDLEVRQALQLFASEQQREALIIARAQDCARLLVALEKESLLPPGMVPHPVSVPEITPQYVQAIHAYLSRSPARLLLVRMEDVFGQLDQAYLPGATESQYPHWRRKLTLNLEEWGSDPRVQGLTDILRHERGSSVRPQPMPQEITPAQPPLHIPQATYRLQFNSGFTFAQATKIVPYLRQLGISHCYASPYLKARPGSPHGYDMIDHNALNPEIGSPEDFERFVAALREHGMGQILDIVPNHMGIMGSDNAWWLDVLENGPASAYAKFFDIDWFSHNEDLQGKVLLPVLGDHYGSVLENGELQLVFDLSRGEFSIYYYQHRFPVDPAEYARILGYRLDKLCARVGMEHLHMLEFQSLVTVCSHLPRRTETEPEKTTERNRDKEIIKQHLAALCAASPDIAGFVEGNIAEFNSGGSEIARYQLLHELLGAQAYRLAYWRVASDEINYRRFFDVNDLAALRMEEPAVFEATHRLVLDWVATGILDGLRIDHSDGLYDPVRYFQCIQRHAPAPQGASVVAQEAPAPRSLYVVTEKILASHEHLPDCWPIAGTTGYDFLSQCNGLFVDAAAAEKMEQGYAAFIGRKVDFDELCYLSKRLIIKVAMAGELNVLAHLLARIAAADRHTCDFSMNSLRVALAEIVACFPVYRTYVSSEQVSADDIRHVNWAIALAKKRSQAADLGIFDFIRDVLLKIRAQGHSPVYQDTVTAFAMKFQQYTSPVMAKGLEDTSFYLYNRLLSLNEVGGNPRHFGMSVNAFHRANQDRARHFPHAMLATSTHDTKRSEDVRARINVISEMPDEWLNAVRRWNHINQIGMRLITGMHGPDRNDEYLLYQTLLGIWPLEEATADARECLCERVEHYMLKAVREAKAHSSWINPNAEYEAEVSRFVRALIQPSGENRFLADFLPFQQRIARLGMFNSLSQVLIKLTSPGVPDLYQGNESWDFSLVDPDNRRQVNYPARQSMLAKLQHAFNVDDADIAGRARQLLETMQDGRIKLYITWKVLALRNQNQALFRDGSYLPLKIAGKRAGHLVAYARQCKGQAIIVIAPRLFAALSTGEQGLPLGKDVWKDTRITLPQPLDGPDWTNLFTQESSPAKKRKGGTVLMAADVFRNFPYALLVRHPNLPR